MNLGIFTGRLGKDADLRTAGNGDKVLNFHLAVEIGTKAAPKAMWIDCSVWGKRADALSPYLKKATKVTIQGKIHTDEYTKTTGDKGFKLVCNVNDIDIHGGPPAQNHDGDDRQPVSNANRSPADLNDDIPF